MIFLQGRAPAGVVDDDVKEHPCAEQMRGMGEFAKLIHPGRAFVEFDECRINRGHVQCGVRAAKTPKASVSCGRGMNRQQMNDTATKRLDDVRQLAGQIAELAGGWNDGEIFSIELLELNFEFFVARG